MSIEDILILAQLYLTSSILGVVLDITMFGLKDGIASNGWKFRALIFLAGPLSVGPLLALFMIRLIEGAGLTYSLHEKWKKTKSNKE
jgi:hypothetical protein